MVSGRSDSNPGRFARSRSVLRLTKLSSRFESSAGV
jgi:hypothetical protein